MDRSQLELISQALAAAENSIRVAQNLLRNLGVRGGERRQKQREQRGGGSTKEIPGIVGIFDGQFMVTKEGKKYQVPANYASKTLLVPGDTLKMVEQDGKTRFKQIVKIPRKKLWGVLAKKDGKFSVVTEEGSFKILPVSIKHFEGEVGDEATVLVSEKGKTDWAALEKIEKKKREEKKEEKVEKVGEEEDKGAKKELPEETPAKKPKRSRPKKKAEKAEQERKKEEKKAESKEKEKKVGEIKETKKEEVKKEELKEDETEEKKEAKEVKKEESKTEKKEEERKEGKKEGELKEGTEIILEEDEELR